MCQVGEYTFEITMDVVNMVERRTTQSENVKELRFSKNIQAGLNLLISNFAKLEGVSPFPLISRYINCNYILRLISETTTIIVNGRFRSNENFYMTHLMVVHSHFGIKFPFFITFCPFLTNLFEFLIVNIASPTKYPF